MTATPPPTETEVLYPLGDGIGSVALIQHVGDDKSIVNAARVSFGGDHDGPLSARDEKLIGYLLREQHGSPFEHNALTFKVVAPIFVARQWFRHRIACLTGDAVVTFVDTNGRATPKLRKTMAELHQMWHVGERHSGTASAEGVRLALELLAQGCSVREAARRTGMARKTIQSYVAGKRTGVRSSRQRLANMNLRVLNEDTGEFQMGHVADVIDQGVQPVYRVTLQDGKTLTMTTNHRVLTDQGWQTMGEALGLEQPGTGAVMTRPARFMVNGLEAYRDREWLQRARQQGQSLREMADGAGCSPHTVRKWLRVHGLQYSPQERAFPKGHRPWNAGKPGYRLKRVFTEADRAAVRLARSGALSNFWRGGVSPERASIARWTREQAPRVHARYNWTCQRCGRAGGKLHAHHVVPVWADETRARELSNLASVCAPCHREIHKTQAAELAFARTFDPAAALGQARVRSRGFKLVAHPVEVVGLEYLGEQQTYDLSVEGPWHNFVANGMVVHNSYNEISGRYVEVKEQVYTPQAFRQQARSNRQASVEAGEALDQGQAHAVWAQAWRQAYAAYQALLGLGVTREQARGVLPLALYTEFYFSCNLRALLHFLELRDHAGAQYETRLYARALRQLAEPLFPATFRAWEALQSPKPS